MPHLVHVFTVDGQLGCCDGAAVNAPGQVLCDVCLRFSWVHTPRTGIAGWLQAPAPFHSSTSASSSRPCPSVTLSGPLMDTPRAV